MMNDSKTVALIPARGGSKDIPGKNLRELNGRPLIDYAIKAALESNVDETWVSTDCEEIEAVALESGARVLHRPEEYATDASSSEEALIHFAKCVDFETLVFLQCTSPLTVADDIDLALGTFEKGEFDSLLSVCEDKGGWLCGGYTWKEELGKPAERLGFDSRQLRQDMLETYRENGAIYITLRKWLMVTQLRVSGNIGMHIMPRWRSYEIDGEEDFLELSFLMESGFFSMKEHHHGH